MPASAPQIAAVTGGRIAAVERASLAARAGIMAGDLLLAINGREIRDVLDYQFYAAEDRLVLTVERPDEGMRTFTISMDSGGHLGIRFEDSTFDGINRCNNRCVFCFVKQLPKGVRRTLYIKDDDYRYSVSYGSFVTLTNLTDEDWQRLAEQRLSPLRVSVHATDLALRRWLLGNPNAPDVLDQLRRLASIGLQAHVQLVLCPGLNDGEHLDRSIRELGALFPTVQSIAAVPVGLSNQNHDPRVRSYTPAEARQIVRQALPLQRSFRQQLGIRLFYLADEFYLLAGRKFPAGSAYDGYPQYENGIGLVRSLLDEWRGVRRSHARGRLPVACSTNRKLTLVCGERIAPIWREIAADLATTVRLDVEVVAVTNEFFGPSITVSGLLTGQDVLRTLRGRPLGTIVLPRAMLDVGGERFLDDLTAPDLESALGKPVRFAGTIRELLAIVSAKELSPAAEASGLR